MMNSKSFFSTPVRALNERRLFASGLAMLGAALAATQACSGGDGDTATSTTTSGAGGGAVAVVGSCSYTNAFSKGKECKLYVGSAWTPTTAEEDCAVPAPGSTGEFSAGGACELASTLGSCEVDPGDGLAYTLAFEGSDAAGCDGAKMGCEVFAKGTFTPSAVCGGSSGSGGSSSSGGFGVDPFVQPYKECRTPLAGEPAGKSEGGKVCTWTLISGATEEGRRYDEYASCADVLTNRPYYGTSPAGSTAANDPRLADAAYMAEVEWARAQVRSTACICCHSNQVAPSGASQWDADDEKGIWLDGISDSGIAIMAGLADSSSFGAFPPAENNGFDRETTGVPTTDIARMQKLFLGEWKRRGFTDEDAKKLEAFGGPLVDQKNFVPSACKNGEGVASGKVNWAGGAARYAYVLEEGSANPVVPPNLDEPKGTLWFVDVPTKAQAFASGITYGELSGELRQRLPEAGKPAALTPGKTYYLYVLRDIALPITRCLFQAK
jgi:hypothetical protein